MASEMVTITENWKQQIPNITKDESELIDFVVVNSMEIQDPESHEIGHITCRADEMNPIIKRLLRGERGKMINADLYALLISLKMIIAPHCSSKRKHSKDSDSRKSKSVKSIPSGQSVIDAQATKIQVGERLSKKEVVKIGITYTKNTDFSNRVTLDVSNFQKKPMLIIRIKEDEEKFKNNKEIIQIIEENLLKFESFSFRIDKIEPGRECAKIFFGDTNDRLVFQEYAKKSCPEYIINVPELQYPQIKMIGVKIFGDITMENWIERIRKFNQWPLDKHLKCVFYHKGEDGLFSITIEVSSVIRDLIFKNGSKIFTGNATIDCWDHIDVKSCTRCCRYGHTKKSCESNSVCIYCSESCLVRCKKIMNKQEWKCNGCGNIGHSFKYFQCPEYIKKVAKKLEQINYNYELIVLPEEKKF